jgi:alpha/beta superfamily hydrolase
VNELAYAARGAGMASLRFNWRGVGGSAGAVSSDFVDAVADYRAALQQMLSTVPGAVIAAGYSFGAGAAQHTAAGEPRVRRLVLIAPPPAMLDLARLDEFPGKTLLLAAGEDAWAPAAELQSIAADRPRVSFACISAADHFFGNGLSEIGRLTAEWLGGDVA